MSIKAKMRKIKQTLHLRATVSSPIHSPKFNKRIQHHHRRSIDHRPSIIRTTTSWPWPHFSTSFKNGLETKVEKSRKQLKERKNMAKKIGGVKKTKASDAAKKK